MKKPKINNLVHNQELTEKIHLKMKSAKSIKITINIDSESLQELKTQSKNTGIPYQRLLNQILKSGLSKVNDSNRRLDKIEKELASIKRKIA